MRLLVPRKICFKCQWNVQWLKYSKEKLSILFLRVFVNTSHVNVCILFYGTLKQKKKIIAILHDSTASTYLDGYKLFVLIWFFLNQWLPLFVDLIIYLNQICCDLDFWPIDPHTNRVLPRSIGDCQIKFSKYVSYGSKDIVQKVKRWYTYRV